MLTMGGLFSETENVCDVDIVCGDRVWKPVPNYEELYYVSNDGLVWSNHSNKVIKPKNNKGYYKVTLCKNGKHFNTSIHRLVALAFIPNPDNKPTVNHINEIKNDNRVENLEWATTLEQNTHGTRITRAVSHTDYKARNIDYKQVASKHDYNKIREINRKPICQCLMSGEVIKTYNSIREAAKALGIYPSHICSCAKGKRNSCKGYRLKYADKQINNG